MPKFVVFLEAPPKIGLSGSANIATRRGTAGKLQQFLNDPRCKIKRAAPQPGRNHKTDQFAVTITTPRNGG